MNASVSKPPGSIPKNFYINKAGKLVPLTDLISDLIPKESPDKSDDSEDSESTKGEQLGKLFFVY